MFHLFQLPPASAVVYASPASAFCRFRQLQELKKWENVVFHGLILSFKWKKKFVMLECMCIGQLVFFTGDQKSERDEQESETAEHQKKPKQMSRKQETYTGSSGDVHRGYIHGDMFAYTVRDKTTNAVPCHIITMCHIISTSLISLSLSLFVSSSILILAPEASYIV